MKNSYIKQLIKCVDSDNTGEKINGLLCFARALEQGEFTVKQMLYMCFPGLISGDTEELKDGFENVPKGAVLKLNNNTISLARTKWAKECYHDLMLQWLTDQSYSKNELKQKPREELDNIKAKMEQRIEESWEDNEYPTGTVTLTDYTCLINYNSYIVGFNCQMNDKSDSDLGTYYAPPIKYSWLPKESKISCSFKGLILLEELEDVAKYCRYALKASQSEDY